MIEKTSNEEVSERVQKEKNLLKTIENRKREMFGHLLRSDECMSYN